MDKLIPVLGVFCCLLVVACIEPFSPELGDLQEVLVIEGQVLEGREPAEVRISRTVEVGRNEELLVGDAQVMIRDDMGGAYLLEEIETGIYQSDTSRLVGTPGTEYQLSVVLATGERYESTWEALRGTQGIDQIYSVLEEQQDSIAGDFTYGMRVLLDTRDTENQSRYYRWEWEETWEFVVPFPTYFSWDFQLNSPVPIPEEDWGNLCWGTQTSTGILLANTALLEEDMIERQPIRFISLETNLLSRRYSLLIKQHVLSQEAYSYWRSLEAINENLGTLFDPIPAEVIGNLRNVDEPNAPVIGYFGAYGFAKERFWMTRQDVPQGFQVSTGYSECRLDSITEYIDFFNALRRANFVYVDSIVGDFGQLAGWMVAPDYCADCKLAGTNMKPDFWP